MAATSRSALAGEYLELWKTLKPFERPAGAPKGPGKEQACAIIGKIIGDREAYEEVDAATSVPWWFVGILHHMEGGGRFDRHLHNGDPLARKTVNVPTGRPSGNGPWTWEESAADALELKGWTEKEVRRLPDGRPDWTLPTLLWRFEVWNGFGYRFKGLRTPYLWAQSNHEQPGRYTADCVFDKNAWSQQVGAAVLTRLMADKKLISLEGVV